MRPQQRNLELAHAQMRLRAAVSAERRAAGRDSLYVFAHLYFAHLLGVPDSVMHRELYTLLQDATQQRGARLAIAAPRGAAKSTLVSGIFILWCLCYKWERYIVLLSDTADKARGFLDLIKTELMTNPLLHEDFPTVAEPLGRRPSPARWRKDEIITRTGIMVTALGSGQKLRGRKHREHRPTLLILDDVDNEDNTATREAREQVAHWFSTVVLKSGAPGTNVIVAGTIQHYDALLATLVDPKRAPGWTGRIYRSVLKWSRATKAWERWTNLFHSRDTYKRKTGPDAAAGYAAQHEARMVRGTEVLWPERESYLHLMIMRESEGHLSFDSEKQNEPVNPAECLFQPEDFYYWDEQFAGPEELFRTVGDDCRIVGACDPSLGKRGGDYSAIITLLYDPSTKHAYVLDADIARRTPEETILAILRYHRLRRYRRFAVESNAFQALMATDLRRRAEAQDLDLNVKEVQHSGDKIARIQGLQPYVKTGRLHFCKRHRELLEQLRFFPKATHDDGPDALEMALTLALTRRTVIVR